MFEITEPVDLVVGRRVTQGVNKILEAELDCAKKVSEEYSKIQATVLKEMGYNVLN